MLLKVKLFDIMYLYCSVWLLLVRQFSLLYLGLGCCRLMVGVNQLWCIILMDSQVFSVLQVLRVWFMQFLSELIGVLFLNMCVVVWVLVMLFWWVLVLCVLMQLMVEGGKLVLFSVIWMVVCMVVVLGLVMWVLLLLVLKLMILV